MSKFAQRTYEAIICAAALSAAVLSYATSVQVDELRETLTELRLETSYPKPCRCNTEEE